MPVYSNRQNINNQFYHRDNNIIVQYMLYFWRVLHINSATIGHWSIGQVQIPKRRHRLLLVGHNTIYIIMHLTIMCFYPISNHRFIEIGDCVFRTVTKIELNKHLNNIIQNTQMKVFKTVFDAKKKLSIYRLSHLIINNQFTHNS